MEMGEADGRVKRGRHTVQGGWTRRQIYISSMRGESSRTSCSQLIVLTHSHGYYTNWADQYCT